MFLCLYFFYQFKESDVLDLEQVFHFKTDDSMLYFKMALSTQSSCIFKALAFSSSELALLQITFFLSLDFD